MFTKSENKYIVVFLVPIMVISGILYSMIIFSVYVSMSKWESYRMDLTFVGLSNYVKILNSERFWAALKNNVTWIVLFMFPTTFLGLVIAYLIVITQRETIFRTIFLVPSAISMTVAGTLWIWMYSTNGAINTLLRIIGLDFLQRSWIADPSSALFSLIFVTIWLYLGFAVVIFESSIKGIDRSVIEAAIVDGASGLTLFWNVIVPQVRGAFLVVAPLLILSALKLFDLVYVTTRGGPGLATDILAYYMWEEAFWKRFMATGAGIAVILLLLGMAIVIPYALWALKRWFS
ncbi:MAG: sugar ABC transporter permease [Thermoprotei archaeon]|nr:MAG: sugar ABC transporter permease [Thermoprotei archaeon]